MLSKKKKEYAGMQQAALWGCTKVELGFKLHANISMVH